MKYLKPEEQVRVKDAKVGRVYRSGSYDYLCVEIANKNEIGFVSLQETPKYYSLERFGDSLAFIDEVGTLEGILVPVLEG